MYCKHVPLSVKHVSWSIFKTIIQGHHHLISWLWYYIAGQIHVCWQTSVWENKGCKFIIFLICPNLSASSGLIKESSIQQVLECRTRHAIHLGPIGRYIYLFTLPYIRIPCRIKDGNERKTNIMERQSRDGQCKNESENKMRGNKKNLNWSFKPYRW